MSGTDLRGGSATTRPNGWSTPEQQRAAAEQEHRAALTVAHHSTSAEECRMLLDMLGLLPAAESLNGDAAVVP